MCVSLCVYVHSTLPGALKGKRAEGFQTGTALEASFPFLLRLSCTSLWPWPFPLPGGPGSGVYQPRGEALAGFGGGVSHIAGRFGEQRHPAVYNFPASPKASSQGSRHLIIMLNASHVSAESPSEDPFPCWKLRVVELVHVPSG